MGIGIAVLRMGWASKMVFSVQKHRIGGPGAQAPAVGAGRTGAPCRGFGARSPEMNYSCDTTAVGRGGAQRRSLAIWIGIVYY